MKYCLCTIIRNEQQYLEEWIKYHLDLGFDKILIYEDTGSSSHEDITSKFDKVELKSCSEFKVTNIEQRQVIYFRQIVKYVDLLDEFDWMIYIDIDEFITFENPKSTLDEIFNNFSKYQIVKLFWQNYNANGHIEQPTGNVLDNFTEKCDILERHKPDNSSCKLALNLKQLDIILTSFDQHRVFKGNWCNTEYENIPEKITYKQIYIRHYITKSFEEYISKIFIRGQFFNSKHLDDFFELNPKLAPIKDKLCEKYAYIINNYSLPKIIHYVWLGGNKTKLVNKCIDSWKKYCSDYKIIEWNEETIKQLQFTEAEKKFYNIFYSKKDYAAVSDLIKLKVLYQYGGIYFNTDVELIKSIPDYMREHNILTLEKFNFDITTTVWGAYANNRFVQIILSKFNKIIETNQIENYGNKWTINNLLKLVISSYNIHFKAYRNYNFIDYVIYAPVYFCPKNLITQETNINQYTIGIHHYALSRVKNIK